VDISQLWTPSLRVGSAREARQQAEQEQHAAEEEKKRGWSARLKILAFVLGVLQAAGIYSGWLGGETLALLVRETRRMVSIRLEGSGAL